MARRNVEQIAVMLAVLAGAAANACSHPTRSHRELPNPTGSQGGALGKSPSTGGAAGSYSGGSDAGSHSGGGSNSSAGNDSGGSAAGNDSGGGAAGHSSGGGAAGNDSGGGGAASCGVLGDRRCDGEHPGRVLVCDGQHWLEYEICGPDTICEASLNACVSLDPRCADREPAEAWCEDGTQFACSEDRLEVTEVPCEGLCSGGACQPPFCGDGKLQPGEQCDDGNEVPRDGCEVGCRRTHIESFGFEGRHACVLLEGGVVRCWGEGIDGRLGSGNENNIKGAWNAHEVDVGGTVEQLAVGRNHTCVILTGGRVRCWGLNTSGQLGYAQTEPVGDDETPASQGDVDLGGARATALTLGTDFTCALLEGGSVRCWGSNSNGQLGYYGHSDPVGDNETPGEMGDVELGAPAVALAATNHHICALLERGAVRCWGNNTWRELGTGDTQHVGDDEPPASVPALQLDAIAVGAGRYHSCALLRDRTVRCWGYNVSGRCGYLEKDFRYVRDPVSMPKVQVGGPVAELAVAGAHTCVRLESGNVRCFGNSNYHELGYGNEDEVGDNEAPDSVDPVPLGDQAVSVFTANQGSCALRNSGGIYCWGRNTGGRFGISIGIDGEFPAPIPIPLF